MAAVQPDWTSPDGTIRLWNQDCLDVLPTLESVDAVVTDPPYGILNVADGNTCAIRKSRRAQGSGKLKDRRINTDSFAWDSEPPSQETLRLLRRMSREQIIWGGNYFDLPPTRCVLVWDKLQPWSNFSQHEMAWTSLDRPAGLFRHSKSDIEKSHPTQKPLPLMAWCLEFIEDCETILDPYMGVATTGIACIRLGRKFLGIEREPKYFDIAVRRIEAELRQPRLFPAATVERQATMFEEVQ